MTKCLVTKLNGVVSDSSLLKVGEMRIKISKSASPNMHTQGLSFTFDDNVTLTIIGNGYFTDKTFTQNLGETISINALISTDVYVNKDAECEVSISNKYALTSLSCFGEYTNLVFSSDLSNKTFFLDQLKYCTKLKSLNLMNCSLEGDISALKNLTALTSINFSQSNVSGDISALKNLTALTSINFSQSNVSGDISALKNLTALTSINFSQSNVSGDISALKNLTALTLINFSQSNVSGDISALKNLTALTSINCNSCYGDITNLKDLNKITTIALITFYGTGDLASIPSSCYFISLNNYKGTGFSWGTRPTSNNIFGIEGNAIVDNVDKMLQDFSNCVKPIISNDKAWYRKIIIAGNRTSASDSAISTLQEKGYTISITPVS